jgi:hypothetical protein
MRKLLSRAREIYCLHQAKNTIKKISAEYKIPGTDIYHTPDAPIVDAKDFHPVLIYDQMMKDRSEYFKIKDLVVRGYSGEAITEENVEAWIHTNTRKVLAFPAFHKPTKPAWMDQTGANPAPIRGDLFKVSARGIFILDKMLENMVNYKRVEVNTVSWLRKNYFDHIKGRTHTTVENPKYQKAWIYLADPERWGGISIYEGWRPLNIYPPRKSEKGTAVYYNSDRNKPLVV